MNIVKTIRGRVLYKNIGTGFWGIEDTNGNQWLPVNLPVSMRQEGKLVSLRVKTLEEENIFMWGTPVEIVG